MAWMCPKCKRGLGGIHFGPGSRSLEQYFFPCYECKLLVDGIDESIKDKDMTDGFFRIQEMIQEELHIDEAQYREGHISSDVENFFHLAWWGKLQFTEDLVNAILLIALEKYFEGRVCSSLEKMLKSKKIKAELLDAREKVNEYYKTYKIPKKYDRFVRY